MSLGTIWTMVLEQAYLADAIVGHRSSGVRSEILRESDFANARTTDN